MPVIRNIGLIDLRLLTFTIDQQTITLHFFVRNPVTFAANGSISSAETSPRYYFLLREIDRFIRLNSDDWHLDSSSRSEAAVRTEVNLVVSRLTSKSEHVYCSMEEIKALKSIGVLSQRAPHAMLITPLLVVSLLHHFKQSTKALIFEAVLLQMISEARQLRKVLMLIKSAVTNYNTSHNLPHDNTTSVELLRQLHHSSLHKAPYPPPYQHHFGQSKNAPVLDFKSLLLLFHSLSNPSSDIGVNTWNSLSSTAAPTKQSSDPNKERSSLEPPPLATINSLKSSTLHSAIGTHKPLPPHVKYDHKTHPPIQRNLPEFLGSLVNFLNNSERLWAGIVGASHQNVFKINPEYHASAFVLNHTNVKDNHSTNLLYGPQKQQNSAHQFSGPEPILVQSIPRPDQPLTDPHTMPNFSPLVKHHPSPSPPHNSPPSLSPLLPPSSPQPSQSQLSLRTPLTTTITTTTTTIDPNHSPVHLNLPNSSIPIPATALVAPTTNLVKVKDKDGDDKDLRELTLALASCDLTTHVFDSIDDTTLLLSYESSPVTNCPFFEYQSQNTTLSTMRVVIEYPFEAVTQIKQHPSHPFTINTGLITPLAAGARQSTSPSASKAANILSVLNQVQDDENATMTFKLSPPPATAMPTQLGQFSHLTFSLQHSFLLSGLLQLFVPSPRYRGTLFWLVPHYPHSIIDLQRKNLSNLDSLPHFIGVEPPQNSCDESSPNNPLPLIQHNSHSTEGLALSASESQPVGNIYNVVRDYHIATLKMTFCLRSSPMSYRSIRELPSDCLLPVVPEPGELCELCLHKYNEFLKYNVVHERIDPLYHIAQKFGPSYRIPCFNRPRDRLPGQPVQTCQFNPARTVPSFHPSTGHRPPLSISSISDETLVVMPGVVPFPILLILAVMHLGRNALPLGVCPFVQDDQGNFAINEHFLSSKIETFAKERTNEAFQWLAQTLKYPVVYTTALIEFDFETLKTFYPESPPSLFFQPDQAPNSSLFNASSPHQPITADIDEANDEALTLSDTFCLQSLAYSGVDEVIRNPIVRIRDHPTINRRARKSTNTTTNSWNTFKNAMINNSQTTNGIGEDNASKSSLLLPQPLTQQQAFPFELNPETIPLYRSLLFHLQELPLLLKIRLWRTAGAVSQLPHDAVVMEAVDAVSWDARTQHEQLTPSEPKQSGPPKKQTLVSLDHKDKESDRMDDEAGSLYDDLVKTSPKGRNHLTKKQRLNSAVGPSPASPSPNSPTLTTDLQPVKRGRGRPPKIKRVESQFDIASQLVEQSSGVSSLTHSNPQPISPDLSVVDGDDADSDPNEPCVGNYYDTFDDTIQNPYVQLPAGENQQQGGGKGSFHQYHFDQHAPNQLQSKYQPCDEPLPAEAGHLSQPPPMFGNGIGFMGYNANQIYFNTMGHESSLTGIDGMNCSIGSTGCLASSFDHFGETLAFPYFGLPDNNSSFNPTSNTLNQPNESSVGQPPLAERLSLHTPTFFARKLSPFDSPSSLFGYSPQPLPFMDHTSEHTSQLQPNGFYCAPMNQFHHGQSPTPLTATLGSSFSLEQPLFAQFDSFYQAANNERRMGDRDGPAGGQ